MNMSKLIRPLRYAIYLSIVTSLYFVTPSKASMNKLLFDYSEASLTGRWISVNDSVMGGISEGGFHFTGNGTMLFSGTLSLENRGGFTSIRSRPSNLNLGGYDTIATRIKGDGRTYYMNLRRSRGNRAGSYRASFQTERGVWQEVRIAFKDFRYTSYGRRLAGVPPITGEEIRSIGFTLADKQPGPFQLEIDWIRAESHTSNKGNFVVEQPDPANGPKDIVDTAVAAGNFNTLIAALNAAGIVDTLKGEGPLTVFAPTDDAFAKLPEGRIAELLKPENREALIELLSYHVLPGKTLLGKQLTDTLQGQSLTITAPGAFQVNEANVIVSDIEASNGVVHAIDSVLVPPSSIQQTSPEAARAVIELAISRGVPLFNSGQPSACAAIYEVAIESLMRSHTDALGNMDRSELRNALREIRTEEQDPRQQAWTLRHALDRVYESLSQS